MFPQLTSFFFKTDVLCINVGLSVCWHVFTCNCTSWSGWQCRPDKLTQIVRGDRLKRSVSSLLYISTSITCVWQKQHCMMDGCPTLSLSTSHSVHCFPLTHAFFTTWFSFIYLSLAWIHFFFVICLSSAIYFSSAVINFLYFWWQQGHGCGSMCLFMGKRWSDNVEICSWSFKLLWQNDLSLCCCLSVVAYIHFSILSAAGGFS